MEVLGVGWVGVGGVGGSLCLASAVCRVHRYGRTGASYGCVKVVQGAKVSCKTWYGLGRGWHTARVGVCLGRSAGPTDWVAPRRWAEGAYRTGVGFWGWVSWRAVLTHRQKRITQTTYLGVGAGGALQADRTTTGPLAAQGNWRMLPNATTALTLRSSGP